MASPADDGPDGPPRALLIAAIAIAVAAIVAVLVVAVLRQTPTQQEPVPIATVPAPQAGSAECTALMAALPDHLGDYRRAPAAEPAPPGTAAWRAEWDTDPVILRCGLDRPLDFVVGVPTQVVEPVAWFELTEADRSTWFAVDRPVYIALTLPSGSGPTPIQEISQAISSAMPARPVDPAPAR
ncbi:DUF3515 domain-containing protein [Mycobacterium sp. ITM-2016-00318]|uniref:DUF3515 domain-containing protein n=1 Tax=Mycobacterium sp. ITM-2016-00318 TaxID=2099693 RepID=UPI000CFA03F0|nr:DUF3515 domain-containing protein [Mycobacterium sp. ITM-2016-00318]WNG94681.1 DUF3515 domain-containing protein [Mycobacterium sp. ITM-2016-00318]